MTSVVVRFLRLKYHAVWIVVLRPWPGHSSLPIHHDTFCPINKTYSIFDPGFGCSLAFSIRFIQELIASVCKNRSKSSCRLYLPPDKELRIGIKCSDTFINARCMEGKMIKSISSGLKGLCRISHSVIHSQYVSCMLK